MKQKIISGDKSTSIIGDNNEFIFNGGIVKRSYLYDLCKIICNSSINYSSDYNIDNNPDWDKKLDINKVIKYKEIFELYCDGYDTVEDILHEYEYRETVIKKVRAMYIKLKFRSEDQNMIGDYFIENIFNEIKALVESSLNLNEPIYDEDLDESIYLIIFYTITKCKILENPS